MVQFVDTPTTHKKEIDRVKMDEERKRAYSGGCYLL
jgi:hypothetical protein